MKYKNIPIDQITFYKHPIIYLELFILLIGDIISWIVNFMLRKGLYVLLAVGIWFLIGNVSFLHPIKSLIIFALYWIILGVASSIGLGTGLHTFVLYLGPHIAKVTMIATSCGHLPQMIPSRWQFNHFGACQVDNNHHIGFFGILLAVQIQSFLWGFGTALGQLPPYFVARKASQTRAQLARMSRQQQNKKQEDEQKKKLIQQDQNIIEIRQLKKKSDKTLMDKAKIIIFDNLQKYGFITVLLCASIPNPLFDLAGITCGHFRIPFKTFFTATFIGKAIIKVHIQMLFVITVFRKETVDYLLGILGHINAKLSELLSQVVIKQKEALHSPHKDDNKPLIAKIWDIFIILMITYFVVSIINGQIQQKAIKLKDKS